jgi:hypothetical protein
MMSRNQYTVHDIKHTVSSATTCSKQTAMTLRFVFCCCDGRYRHSNLR